MKYTLKFNVKNNREYLLVFIHGLFGSEKTWQTTKHNTLMDYFINNPELNSKFDISLFEYYTSPFERPLNNNKIELIFSKLGFNKRTRKIISISATSKILAKELKYKCSNYKGIILIGHSMGGLISKYLITNNLLEKKPLNIKLYISLAVPHNGSLLANIAKTFFGSQQIKGLGVFDSERHTLNQNWVQAGQDLPRTIYFEGESDDVVGPESAISYDSRKDNFEIIPVDHSHFSIVKPESDEDLVVVATTKECLKVYETIERTETISNNNIPALKSETQRIIEKYERKELDLYNQKLKNYLINEIKNVIFFERSFKLKNYEEYNFEQLKQEVAISEYSVIYGIGGLGKSIVCRKIIIDLFDLLKNPFFIFCDGKRFDSTSLNQRNGSDFEIDFKELLEAFDCIIDFNYVKRMNLDKVDHSFDKFIFVDGFNEIPSESNRQDVLNILKKAHHRYGFKILLITRNFDINEFKRFSGFGIERIAEDQLEYLLYNKFGRKLNQYSTRNLEYLSIPFFLDIAINSGNDIINGYSDYILSHVLQNLPNNEHIKAIKELSNLAFAAFGSSKKFLIHKTAITFKKKADYVDTKILIKDGDYYKFEHHLINEYFIAHRIAITKELWTNEIYDKITFEDKRSFEVIQMVLEQIDIVEDADMFLETVYDWNFYAVMHALLSTENKVSEQLAKAMVLIFSEKLFDNFYHTRKRISSNLIRLLKVYPLSGINSSQISQISEGNDGVYNNLFYDLLENNKNIFSNNKYSDWFEIYSLRESKLNFEYLQKIVTDNSIVGWSTANVIKRNKLSIAEVKILIDFYNSSNNYMHKWRIVHALGSSNLDASLNFLFEKFVAKENTWISYGCIRSILEIGLFYSNSESLKFILQKVYEILVEVDFSKIIMAELRACLINKLEFHKYSIVESFLDKCISTRSGNFSDKDLFEISLKQLKNINEKSDSNI